MADKDSDSRSLKKKLNDPDYMVSMTSTAFFQILFLLQFFIKNNKARTKALMFQPKPIYTY